MTDVVYFIQSYEGEQQKIMKYLHELFTSRYELASKMRYKIPFYDGKSWICYLNPTKKKTVELAFVRGNELENAAGLLQSKGRKQVMSVEITSLSAINEELIEDLIQEAIILDDVKPYESKRTSR